MRLFLLQLCSVLGRGVLQACKDTQGCEFFIIRTIKTVCCLLIMQMCNIAGMQKRLVVIILDRGWNRCF